MLGYCGSMIKKCRCVLTAPVVVLILLLSVLAFSAVKVDNAYAADAGGTYKGVPWKLSGGVLTIGESGSGYYFEDNIGDYPWIYNLEGEVTSVKVVGKVHAGNSASSMFSGLENCKTIDLSGLVTDKASNMASMFSGCEALTSIDVSSLATGKVKASALKKNSRTYKPIKIIKHNGTVTYSMTGGSAKSKKALKLNSKNGKITVKKGTKKGTYKLKIKVTAKGTTEYKRVPRM